MGCNIFITRRGEEGMVSVNSNPIYVPSRSGFSRWPAARTAGDGVLVLAAGLLLDGGHVRAANCPIHLMAVQAPVHVVDCINCYADRYIYLDVKYKQLLTPTCVHCTRYWPAETETWKLLTQADYTCLSIVAGQCGAPRVHLRSQLQHPPSNFRHHWVEGTWIGNLM